MGRQPAELHSLRRLLGQRGFASKVVYRRTTAEIIWLEWNKVTGPAVYHVDVSGVDPQFGSFEELAMPLFDPLYNFAHWLTRNRDQAEDLVQETYLKALKGFSSFQLGTNFRA